MSKIIALTPSQQSACNALLNAMHHSQVVSLDGPAGTGKTVAITHLVDALKQRGKDVSVVAYTNVAAHVLRSKGLENAMTIHKAFYIPTVIRGDKTIKPRFVNAKEWMAMNPEGQLPGGKKEFVDVIVVDEASMLPGWMAYQLRQMCNHLVLVGDGSQLPPVGDSIMPRGYFNTLVHTASLTEIHRQRDGSPVLGMATRIRTGMVNARDQSCVIPFHPGEVYPGKVFRQIIEDIEAAGETWAIVTYTNKMRHGFNNMMRRFLGYEGMFEPQPGEKMMSYANFSDGLLNGTPVRVVKSKFMSAKFMAEVFDVYNKLGRENFVPEQLFTAEQIVACAYPSLWYTTIDGGEDYIKIDIISYIGQFEDQFSAAAVSALMAMKASADKIVGGDPEPTAHVEFGYAITCHKAQGSEYAHVFVADERPTLFWVTEKNAAADTTAVDPLQGDEVVRRWMYTAYTRAQQKLTVFPSSMLQSVKKP